MIPQRVVLLRDGRRNGAGHTLPAMAHILTKVLLGIGTAMFWEEVVRPDLVVADLERSPKRPPGPMIRWHGPLPPDGRLPYRDGSLGTLLLIDSVEQSASPIALLAEATRVSSDVHVLMPRPWNPGTWLDPKSRWILLGKELHPVPGRKGQPVWLPDGVSVVLRHSSPLDSARRLVEDGVRGALG